MGNVKLAKSKETATVEGGRTRRGRRGSGVEVRPEAIRQARVQANLTMAELAGDELTRGAIYLFETGRARPSEEVLEHIAARTQKPLAFFKPPQGVAIPIESLARLDALLRQGLAEEALELGNQLLGSAAGPRQEAAIRLRLASAELALGSVETALLGARHARRLAEDGGDAGLAAEARLGEVQALQQAQDPEALRTAREALDRVRSLPRPAPPWLETSLLHAIGVLHEQRGEWAAAVDAYQEVVDGGAAAPALQRAVDALEGEAKAHAGQDAEAEAAAYWQAAGLRAWRSQLPLVLDSMIALARSQAWLGEREGAGRALREAADRAEAEGLEEHRRQAVLELAALALQDGDPDEARRQITLARQLAEAAGDRHALGQAHLLAGRLAAAAGDADEANTAFERSLADLEAAGDTTRLLDAVSAYAEVLEAQGDVAGALRQWKRATGLARPDLRHPVLPVEEARPSGGARRPPRRRARGA